MKLWILRHAQAEGTSRTGLDIDRRLTKAGQMACHHLKEQLDTLGLKPPRAQWVSPSARTRQTAEMALAGWPDAEIVIEPALWEASLGDLLALIERHQAESGQQDLLLVGHNPGLEMLIEWLGGELPVPGLKPGTLVVVEVDTPPTPDSARTLQRFPPIESR